MVPECWLSQLYFRCMHISTCSHADQGSHVPQTPYKEVAHLLQELGLEPGWGRTVQTIQETIGSLLDVLQAPDASLLENFLSRLPIVQRVAILSPHGFFGQSNVLGKPDTGGQVMHPPWLQNCCLTARGSQPESGWAA